MTSHWEQLLRIACDLIDRSPLGGEWTFGGGTALMLQIDHRLSQDIDLFVDDPQYLAYLDPARQSLPLCNQPMSYIGDGHRFLKIAFEEIGQIDFYRLRSDDQSILDGDRAARKIDQD